MKAVASAVLLSCLALVGSHRALGAEAKNDPGQFPLAVHISASTYATENDSRLGAIDQLTEIVTATIDGKHYQLSGPTSSAKAFMHGNGLINPGDYHAKLVKDDHKTSYESQQTFEILFPDGTTRSFFVIAQSE
jgi:hypothetical protein